MSHRKRLSVFVLLVSALTIAQAQSVYDSATAAAMQAYREGNFGEAEKQFKKALKDLEAVSPSDARVGVVLVNLATVKKAQGQDKEVEPLLKRAITVLTVALGPHHPDLATTHENLGMFYYDQLLANAGKTRNDIRGAYPAFRVLRGYSGGSSALSGGGGAGAQAADALARAHQKAAKEDPQVVYAQKAEESLRQALAIREKHFGGASADIVSSLRELGELYMVTERFSEAETTLRRARAVREQIGGADDAEAAAILNMLASLFRNQENYAEAEPLYQRALAIQERVLGPEHADLAATLQAYAILLKETERKDEAKKLEARAKEIRKKNPQS